MPPPPLFINEQRFCLPKVSKMIWKICFQHAGKSHVKFTFSWGESLNSIPVVASFLQRSLVSFQLLMHAPSLLKILHLCLPITACFEMSF